MIDERLDIQTPENVAFGYQVAGIGSRFIAALLDTLLIVLLQIVVNLLLILVLGASLGVSGLAEGDSQTLSWLAALFGLVAFAFLWGYYIFFEMWWNGQSPGKRWVGLRVIRDDGTPISLSEAIIRNLVRIIDFLPLYYGVGVITMFVDKQARRLGDLAAGTLVVYDRGPVTLQSLERHHSVAAMPDLATAADTAWDELPLQKLEASDVTLAESYLSRQYELRNESELAVEVAQSLLKKMDVPAQTLQRGEALALLRTVAQRDAFRQRASQDSSP